MLLISVILRKGKTGQERELATMKITNEGPTSNDGEFFYTATWRNGRGVRTGASWVRHFQRDDVWALIRKVLNHSVGTPGYCPTCHRQEEPDEPAADRRDPVHLQGKD